MTVLVATFPLRKLSYITFPENRRAAASLHHHWRDRGYAAWESLRPLTSERMIYTGVFYLVLMDRDVAATQDQLPARGPEKTLPNKLREKSHFLILPVTLETGTGSHCGTLGFHRGKSCQATSAIICYNTKNVESWRYTHANCLVYSAGRPQNLSRRCSRLSCRL